jgi:hypothetical protein
VTRRRARSFAPDSRGTVEGFDYAAPAEMFMTRAKLTRRPPIGYRRFETAAEAIQFAIELVPPPMLIGAILEVREQRYDHRGIRELYNRDGYPLGRRDGAV